MKRYSILMLTVLTASVCPTLAANSYITGQKQLAFQFDQTSGRYSVLSGDSPLLSNISAEVSCEGAVLRTPELRVARSETIRRTETFGPAVIQKITFAPANGLQLGLELFNYGSPWCSVRAWLKNTSGKPVVLDNFVLLKTAADDVHLGGAFQKWRALTENCGRVVTVGAALASGNLSSDNVFALQNPANGRSLVLGFSVLEAFGDVSLARADGRTNLEASAEMDQVIVPPGKIRWSEKLHIGERPVLEGLEEDAAQTGREAGAITNAPSYAGWVSWYMYNPFWDRDVAEDDLVAYLDGVKKFRSELPLQVMVLDDGYQALPGDWTTPRPLFPHGMKWLTDRAKEAGIRPGLWIGLPLVNEHSKLFKEHPDWVDRKADGTPQCVLRNWGTPTYSLDISRKDVLNHIHDLIQTITRDWGFQYIKLDFLIAPSERRADRSLTDLQIMRQMLRTVREAAGPDVFISSCPASPYAPAVGVAQSGRMSDDVTPNWDSVRESSRESLLRSVFHRRWLVNDPDCIMFRETDSSLTLSEVRVLATTDALVGGLTQFADPLLDLPPARRRMLGQVLPSCGQSARPVDIMQSDIPQVFDLPIERPFGNWHVVALYNWSDQPADIKLDLTSLGLDPQKKYHLFDFWTDTYFGLAQGSYVFTNRPPHSVLALSVREEIPGQIEFISDDLHILQGALEVTGISRRITAPFGCKAEMTMTLKPVSLREGKLIFRAGNLVLAACQGAKGKLVKRPDGLWEVQLQNIADQVALLLRWR